MIRRSCLAALAAGTLLGDVGCRHCCHKPGPPPTPFLPPAPSGPSNIPAIAVPTSPGPSLAVPVFPPPAPQRGGNLPPPADPLLGTPAPGGSNFGPPQNGAKPGRELLLPDPLPSASGTTRSQYPAPAQSAPRGILGDPIGPRPQTAEPPLAPKPLPATPDNGFPPPAEPSAVAPKAVAPADRFAGLSGFVAVKAGVSTGRKPTAEGLDMLKKSGYRTVVYLHGEGADVSGYRAEVEKRGLAFSAIELTPSLLPSGMEAFNAAVGSPANRPVYLADDDGLRTGAAWYVHFRTVEIMNADAARVRARPLGYAEGGDEAKTFQVAIQHYLAAR